MICDEGVIAVKKSIKDEFAKKALDAKVEEAEELIDDDMAFEEKLLAAEKKLSNIPKIGDYLAYLPTLISMVNAWRKKEYTEIPVASILMVSGAILYFLSPIDTIPDAIPGVGLVDDAAVIALAVGAVGNDIKDYRKWQETEGIRESEPEPVRKKKNS